VGGFASGNFTSTQASNTQIFTLGVPDAVSTLPFSGSGSHLSGGVIIGANVFQAGPVIFGAEFGADFSGGNQTFIGNVANGTTGTNTDRVGFTLNDILAVSGTATIPVSPNLAVIVRGGPSWLHGEAQLGCFGSCIAAGTAPFNVTQDVNLTGWHFGVGAQGQFAVVNGMPVILRGEWIHHSFDGANVSAGNPAAASIAFNVRPEVDQGRVSVIFPFNVKNFMASDRRLKRDVERIGNLANGLGLYRYKYLDSDQDYVGVMAQEVRLLMPDAIATGADGFMRVNYDKVGCSFQTWDQYQASTEAL
jgi:hypothetical protein